MKLRTLFLGLLVIAGVGILEARTVKYTISLVQPDYAEEINENGWVDSNPEVEMPGNMEFFIDQWNPLTGQIRVDCNYGCWSSNFRIANKTPFKGAITKVELVYSSGELDPEFVTFETKTGNFPVFYGDYVVKVEPGKLVWDLDWHGKKDKFHIQIEASEEQNTSRVIVSEINVYYNSRVRCDTDEPAVEEGDEDDEEEEPKPIEPAPIQPDPITPIDPKPIADPRIGGPGGGWLSELINEKYPQQPQAPQDPEVKIVDTFPEDPTQPEPPGTIDVKIKKHLLEPLTEEEFAMIKAKRLPFGNECLDATRNWVRHIPDIIANESAECQAELRKLTYNDYLQFMHASFESAAVDFVNIVTMTDEEYYKKEEQFLRQAKDSLLILGAEWVRLYDIKDPNMDQTIRAYCEKNLPFMITVNKYQSLFQYIFF